MPRREHQSFGTKNNNTRDYKRQYCFGTGSTIDYSCSLSLLKSEVRNMNLSILHCYLLQQCSFGTKSSLFNNEDSYKLTKLETGLQAMGEGGLILKSAEW